MNRWAFHDLLGDEGIERRFGVLIWAKRTGKLSNLRQALDDLQNTGKFRLSQMLYQKALQEVGK